ncbi:MAG TPA: MarR family transcriptional regulator [Candidatus Paceibacterota bacterium]|nr:MarR family transcriptional regulator [Candidatus Paceibacterota bacterium]
MKTHKHRKAEVARAATIFFRVRSLVRHKLAGGARLDPYAWLRIETLAYIGEHNPTMSEIAEYLAITAPSATSLIASLARAGLVARATSKEDRRVLRISLTAKGKATLKAAFARGARIFSGVFAPLSAPELAAFSRLLAKLERGSRD